MMNCKLPFAVFFVAAVCFATQARNAAADKMAVSAVKLAGFQKDYAHVQFDISWDNSFRMAGTPAYRDAAWVFVKYRSKGDADAQWKHATLATEDKHHVAPAGSTINAVADGKGVFVYRSAPGRGTADYKGVKLRWNYGADGLTNAGQVDVSVLALEMVYISQGRFELGCALSYREYLVRGPRSEGMKEGSKGSYLFNFFYRYSDATAKDPKAKVTSPYTVDNE